MTNRALVLLLCSAAKLAALPAVSPSNLNEVWGYLDSADRGALNRDLPLTDVAVFAASINSKGQLVGVPSPFPAERSSARAHLVVAELGNTALTHFVLDPVYPLRDRLVTDIAMASKPFDGVQIDFEAVARYDKENYLQFLVRLKQALGPKILSVAVPARWKAVDDAQDYTHLARIADRLVIMAYDEHWSTSAPGAIASVEWGSKVAAYALATLGRTKTVMGLPFYGRAWGEANPAGGYRYSGVQRVLGETEATMERNAGGIPSFKFTRTLAYTMWYEDSVSLEVKANLYLGMGVANLAFWRLGQEDKSVWSVVKKKRGGPSIQDLPRYVLRLAPPE